MSQPSGLSVSDGVSDFGYQPQFKRVLRPYALFAVGFSVISLTTGIFVNYGFALNNFGPASIWLWIPAAIGQLLVALVLAELSTRIPLAGANYQWGAKLVSPTYGWFIGALGFIYNTVAVPGIMLVAASPLTISLFGWDPDNGALLLGIALVYVFACYILNIVSIRVASQVNNVAVVTEIIGTVVFAAVVFVLWLIGTKTTPHNGDVFHFLSSTTSTASGSPFVAPHHAARNGV